MYEFDKMKDEDIVFISDNTILKSNNNDIIVSTIVTSKRLLLLNYPNNTNDYKEILRVSRGMDYIRKRELILAIGLDEIARIEEDVNYDKYILKNGNFFFINDNEVKAILNNKVN